MLYVHTKNYKYIFFVCFHRPRTGPIPPALNPPPDKAITIYFSAILPKAAWEWDNKSSSVYMRFMGAHFNTHDVGPGRVAKYVYESREILHAYHMFSYCRHGVDDLFIVNFPVTMDVGVLTSLGNIFYKYVVFSPRMEEVGHPYEYLHGAPHGDGRTNRVLRIPKTKCVPQG